MANEADEVEELKAMFASPTGISNAVLSRFETHLSNHQTAAAVRAHNSVLQLRKAEEEEERRQVMEQRRQDWEGIRERTRQEREALRLRKLEEKR